MLSLKLAWRNLFRNTRRTVLTTILISSALIVIILVDGLILGMKEVMISSLTHTLEGEAQVLHKDFRVNYDAEYTINEPDDILDRIAEDETIAGYAPRILIGGMIASSYNTTGGLIYGVDAEQEPGVSRIRDAIVEGDYLTGQPRELLLGTGMADLLEVELGDRIILTAAAVDTNELSQELFRVSGILKFGPEEMDETMAFINLEKAQAVFGMQGKLHQIALRFSDPELPKNADLPIFTELTEGDIEAVGWLDLQPAFGAMLEMTNYSTALVGIILFTLTSLGVINSMFMSIYERIYEFGVIKAVGTRPLEIIVLVLVEALLLALFSCAIGIALGYIATDYFSTNGIPMGKMEVSGIVIDGNMYTRPALYQFINFPIYVTLLTVAAAIYPAVFASRIVPTRALQKAL